MVYWYVDVLYYDILMPHSRLILNTIIFFTLIKSFLFVKEVLRKKLLIQAFAQQMCDEISRLDIKSTEKVADKAQEIMATFTLEALPGLYDNNRGTVFESETDDVGTLANTGQSVLETRTKLFKSFLGERKVVRWVFDGLEALIGENKSIEVSWAKGLRYLDKFSRTEDKDSLPWMSTYMKVLNLPHNYSDKNFTAKILAANSRLNPKGYCSLWVASHMFNYKKRLRYFELRGNEAWEKLLKFKAGKPSDF